jgi:hypothetical protein
MPHSFVEPLTKLRAVPIVDNGEAFVDHRRLSGRIHFAAKPLVTNSSSRIVLT